MPNSPASGAMRFQVQGDDLNKVYRQLRQADPKMAAALRRGIKDGAQPVVDAVRQSAEAQGLHRAAAATSVAFSSSSRLGLTATIKTDHKKAPMARPLEGGSQRNRGSNRHPVFQTAKNPDTWVSQPLRPYFWPAIVRTSPTVYARIKANLDAVLRQL